MSSITPNLENYRDINQLSLFERASRPLQRLAYRIQSLARSLFYSLPGLNRIPSNLLDIIDRDQTPPRAQTLPSNGDFEEKFSDHTSGISSEEDTSGPLAEDDDFSYQKTIPTNSNIPSAIDSLKNRKPLNNSTITETLGTFTTLVNNEEKFEYENKYLQPAKIIETETVYTLKSPVAIPVVIKGRFRDHIVTFFISSQNNTTTIEFFDPQGYTLKDRLNNKTLDGVTKIKDIFASLQQQILLKDASVISTSKIHQKDSYNCGVYVLDYIERRLDGESMEDIDKKPLSFSEANGSKRAHFITQLSSNSNTFEI